jgi:hypothetical protein
MVQPAENILRPLSGNRLATHADGCLGAAPVYWQNPGLQVPSSHVVVPDCSEQHTPSCRSSCPFDLAI